METRDWYRKELANIPNRINPNLSLRDRGLQSFKLRNEIKLQGRDLMSDKEAVFSLPEPKTLRQLASKAYHKEGLVGDDFWSYIINGAQRSNAAVDSKFGY